MDNEIIEEIDEDLSEELPQGQRSIFSFFCNKYTILVLSVLNFLIYLFPLFKEYGLAVNGYQFLGFESGIQKTFTIFSIIFFVTSFIGIITSVLCIIKRNNMLIKIIVFFVFIMFAICSIAIFIITMNLISALDVKIGACSIILILQTVLIFGADWLLLSYR